MSEADPKSSALGDIIGATRKRLEEPRDPADRLRGLVAATVTATSDPVSPGPMPRVPHDVALPPNYFPQVATQPAVVPKRKPQRGPTRSLHISMRLSVPERDRLVRWCEVRNLSLPDGIVALLDLAEGNGTGDTT